MSDPFADVRKRLKAGEIVYFVPEIKSLLTDADALLAVVRVQEKLIALYEKDASSFMAIRLTHGLNSPDEDVKLGRELREEIATALPDHLIDSISLDPSFDR